MNKLLQRVGTLCLLLCCVVLAKAQDVTALWDFQYVNPTTLTSEANLQGATGTVSSTVDGVVMTVDATSGKLKQRDSDAQFNAGTILKVPVKSTRDTVTVVSYPGYHNYTIGGTAADADSVSHKATTTEVAQGYVEVVGTGSSYLYRIRATFVSAIQEKALYSTTFTEWGAYETKATTAETTVSWQTKYSHETLTFSIYNTQIGASNFNTGKFPTWEGGMLMAAKSSDPYIITSALASITKVHFIHGATGGNRGWKLEAKGDGDADWVVISNSVANPSSGCEVTVDVNRTNCQLRFTNLTTNQNAYLFQLDIYGNVDMSKTPALGTFSYNGTTYQAADIFSEDANGDMTATIEVFNDVQLPSESSPVTDLTFDNGELSGAVTYETTTEGVVVTMNVTANNSTVAYKATFIHKPYYTLTYYNTDGKVLEATQKVEKDRAITTLRNSDGVTVADGCAFRGWFVSADGGQKYNVADLVTEDLSLYAVATEIEVESTTKSYTYDLTSPYFYDEDHEAFNATNGAWHDKQHGWAFSEGGKIDLLVGGRAYIALTLCQYSASSNITLTDASGAEVASINAKGSKDAEVKILEYTGEAGTITLNVPNGVYIHKVILANAAEYPIEKNEQGWYVVSPGNGGHLLTTLMMANANASSTERTYIFVPDGTYDLGSEVLTPISGNNISLIGQSMENTIIVNEAPTEGIGVSATFLITGQNTYLQDLTLKNAYDYYQPGFAGRAVVIQDKGSRTICKNVRMLSYQDTYYSNANSQFYFETSDIHGTVDFICGGGDVFFNKCTLTVEPRTAAGTGECTITAPYTDSSNKFGYVFDGCTIDCKAEKFNYGRAWGGVPRCAYLNTTLLQPSKLNNNRWTAGGMNVAADKFVEYNTMDSEGAVISPDTWVMTFTKDKTSNKIETILTAEQAAEYALDKVFTNWTPADYAAQVATDKLVADGNTFTWTAVEGATTYAVFKNGVYVGMTSTPSYTFTDGEAADYTVRTANSRGGFGDSVSTNGITGISNTTAGKADVISTTYYNAVGARVSGATKGLLIKVDMTKDGKRTATKILN